MKKLVFIILVTVFGNMFSQTSIFVVNNYSAMTLEGILYANPTTVTCYPMITSTHPSVFNIIVQPGTPSMPYTVSYKKYKFANDPATNFPLSQWWVQVSASTGSYRSVLHPSFNIGGVFDTQTNWTGFYFVTKDASGYHEEHPIGNPDYFLAGCTPCAFSYNNAGITEAEWFTIGEYTYVQVY